MAANNKKPERTPKYRIGVYREGAHLPFEQRFAADKGERERMIRQLAEAHPGHRIEVRLLKGFIHGFPVRWRYEVGEGKGGLDVLSRYNKYAIGTKPPTEKQLESAKRFPLDT